MADSLDILDRIPTWEQLYRIAPTGLVVLGIAGAGAALALFIVRDHIKSLRDFIEYLKHRGND